MIGRDTQLLVLAPHVDDELNCAGLISRVTAAGGKALIVAHSPCYLSIRAEDHAEGRDITSEFKRSCGVLRADHILWDHPVRELADHRQEILEGYFGLKRAYDFSLVVCPSSTDLHQDHAVVHAEAMRAFRNARHILGWESPNNQRQARIDTFVALQPHHLEDKVLAWKEYETQHHRTYFDECFLRSQAYLRGCQCRAVPRLAEGFEHLSQTL